MSKIKVKKGDQVMVLAGKDKGNTGEILVVYPAKDKVIVSGVNMMKKHTKPNAQKPDGGIIETEAPIQVSNISLMENGKPVKIGYKIEGDKKIRISRKSGNPI